MAGAGVTAAAVWVDVLPSMRNFGSSLTEQLGPEGERAGSRMGESTQKGLKGHVAALAAVGATIGLAVGAAAVQALDIAAGRTKMQVQLGLSAQDGQRYGRLAGELYSGAYGENIDQVNEALVSVTRNIGGATAASDADLKSVAGTVLNLASTFDVDLGGATAAVGQLLKTGLAPDAKSALDIITVGLQGGVDKAGDFLDTLNEYGTQFRSLGLSGQTATGLLSQGLKAGARDADQVADALKEFSIRAVDGSKASADGFAAVGLNAKDMTTQIAQGGAPAAAGLQLVLDSLRKIKDPAAQSQAAMALFGTQAEDMKAALLGLDPSTAVEGLGQVAGKAEEMNTALGETAAGRIESFKRSLMTGIVDFIGGAVLPALDSVTAVGATLFGEAWGPVREFLGFLGSTGGIVVGVLLGIVAATWLWTAASAALAGTWLANPITWIIIGIAAAVGGLVAAVIWAWNNFEGFRSVVMAVWSGIQTAASTAWSILSAIFTGIGAAIGFVGGIISWLWTSIVEPVFSFIWTAARVLAAVVLTVLITPLVLGFQLVGWALDLLWTGVISPVFGFIGALATWLWVNVLQPVFGGIGAGVGVLGGVFTWLYANIVQPVFSAISALATWLWVNVLQPVFSSIGQGWSLLMSGLDSVYQSVLRPLFDGVMSAARSVGDAFGWAVDRIADVWGRIQGIVRPPIDFVVNIVYNRGIRPAWNFIAGLFGLGQLPEYTFADGGLVPGQDLGYDYVHAVLRGGEGVLVPEATRMLGGGPGIDALNRYAEAEHFAEGGIAGAGSITGSVGGNVSGSGSGAIMKGLSLVDFITDPIGSVKRLFDFDTGPLRGVGQLSEALLMFPAKMLGAAIDKVKTVVADFFTSTGASGELGQWIGTAMAITGVPASWAGPLNTLIMRESGGNPNAINLWDSNAQAGHPSRGLMQTIPSTFAAYRDPRLPNNIVDPIANIVAGINYIKGRYGTIFNVQQAVGSTPRGYDSGGYLPPGWSTVFNGTGRPEPVLTDQQWQDMAGGARGGDGVEELVITSGWLEVREDGLVRLVDGRLERRIGNRINNGRRA